MSAWRNRWALSIEELESRRLLSGTTVAYWRFEGAPGTAATTIVDSSGNGFDGTAIGGPLYSPVVPASTVPQTGLADDSSLSFSGSQRVFVPDNPAFAITGNLTIEAYIDVQGTPDSAGQIVFRGDDRIALDPYTLDVIGDDLQFHISDASGNVADVDAPIPGQNVWFSVAAKLNATTGAMKLYIDNVLAASTTTSVRPFAALDPSENPGLGIGDVQSDNYQEHFDGLIDEVRISDAALPRTAFLSYPATGTIKGTIFNDVNGDNIQEASEPPLAGWTVFLDSNDNGVLDPGEMSVNANVEGDYVFNDVPAGTYHVDEILQPGWLAISKATRTATITGGATVTRNFASALPATISGTVLGEFTRGRYQELTPLAGWTVYVDSNDNGELDAGELSTTTDPLGRFSFAGLLPGTYVIRVVAPSGYDAVSAPAAITVGSGGDVSGVGFVFRD